MQLESERLRKLAEATREQVKSGGWAASAQLELMAIAAQYDQAAALALIAESLSNVSSH